MGKFNDYLIFVDESGDAGISHIDPVYPILTLAFVIVKKEDYVDKIIPAFTSLKLKYWGHDEIVFHERDFRKEKGDFSFFRGNLALKNSFLNDLTIIMQDAPFQFVASTFNKNSDTRGVEPYSTALVSCFAALKAFIKPEEVLHLVFEARGVKEDAYLHDECNQLIEYFGYGKDLIKIRFAHKQANSIGLQLADLIARPMGLSYLRPYQVNRAIEILHTKIIRHYIYP